jgi:F1F0 ATPase subunit 2
MNEVPMLLLSLLNGIALGVIYFGGLWLTIQKGIFSRRMPILFFSSLLLRMSIILVGFYIVSGGHFERLLVCLLAFVMTRIVITRSIQSAKKSQLT